MLLRWGKPDSKYLCPPSRPCSTFQIRDSEPRLAIWRSRGWGARWWGSRGGRGRTTRGRRSRWRSSLDCLRELPLYWASSLAQVKSESNEDNGNFVSARHLCISKGCLKRSWLCGSFIDSECYVLWNYKWQWNLKTYIPQWIHPRFGFSVDSSLWSAHSVMQNWVSSSPIRPISNQLYLIYTFLDVCENISYIFSIWTGTSIPKSGADYAYIGEAFGSLPSFLYLWDAIFIFVPTTNAIMGLTVANYMAKPLFPDCDPPDEALRLIAAVSETIPRTFLWVNFLFGQICITGLTWLNCYSTKATTKLQNLFMVTLFRYLHLHCRFLCSFTLAWILSPGGQTAFPWTDHCGGLYGALYTSGTSKVSQSLGGREADRILHS